MSISAEQTTPSAKNDKKILVENIFSFPGGIFPQENKAQTTDKGIIEAELPKELIVPLQQHIGAPAKACVNVGDRVLKGQTIGQANGFVSVNIHAPSSGTVTAIEEREVQHPSGLAGNSIVIATDGMEQWAALDPCDDYQNLSKVELMKKIQAAGIAGMGGAGFPSAVKLSVKNKQINTLLLNSAECEPYITADDVLIQQHAKEVLIGLGILNQIIEAKEILIGIEDNKPVAIEAYKEAINSSELDIVKLAIVPTKYPSGGEKQLVQLLTGKEIPVGGLPADLGIVCQNTGTVFAVYEAVVLGKPLISRVTTLTGNALSEPQNYRALIGTPFRSLLEQAGITWNNLSQLVMGGPMMGFAVHSPDVPLVKTTNCILASAPGELTSPELEQPCIRCGSCAEVCPVNLLPQQLYWYSKAKELEKAKEYHLGDCIECGACSFVCPSNIPLVQYFRFGKGEIRKKNIELEKSELSRERFEARKARLEREEAEKEAKRVEKAEARKLKKAQQAAQSDARAGSEGSSANADSLEIAFQVAKTKSAKATKQWKDAEKALIAAKKIDTEDIAALEQQVLNLEKASQDAQVAFKTALANKKAAVTNTDAADSPQEDSASKALEAKIEDIREESTLAVQELKSHKKNLISAKSGNSDTSEIEKQVSISKEKSDKLKAELRELLKQQKELMASSDTNNDGAKQTITLETSATNNQEELQPNQEPQPNQELQSLNKQSEPFSKTPQPANERPVQAELQLEALSEKDQLKTEMAQVKAAGKELKQQRLDIEDGTNAQEKIDALIEENKKQLNNIVKKMTELNAAPVPNSNIQNNGQES